MAVTFRQLINRVLRAVSEDEIDDTVDSLQDDYHKLVATFVNLILEEVQSANPTWRSLQQDLTATITASTNSGEITGANERSQLVRVHDARRGRIIPLVFDITSPTNPYELQELTLSEIKYRQNIEVGVTTNQAPQFFAIDDSSGDGMNLLVHPTPQSQRSVRVVMTVPQDRFADSDLDVALKVPSLPVELGAIWFALEERGEELGQGGIFTEERYRNALDAAITRDVSEQGGYELVPV